MLSELVEGSMVRTLLRMLVIVVVLVALGAFFMGYRWGTPAREPASDRQPSAQPPAACSA